MSIVALWFIRNSDHGEATVLLTNTVQSVVCRGGRLEGERVTVARKAIWSHCVSVTSVMIVVLDNTSKKESLRASVKCCVTVNAEQFCAVHKIKAYIIVIS